MGATIADHKKESETAINDCKRQVREKEEQLRQALQRTNETQLALETLKSNVEEFGRG